MRGGTRIGSARQGRFQGGEGVLPSSRSLFLRQPNLRSLPCVRGALALSLALVTAAAPFSDAAARSRSRGTPTVAAAIVVDMNGSRILYAQTPDAPRGPASLTKMMTLYVLFSYLRTGSIHPDSELVVTPYAASQSPTKLGLKPGATIGTVDAIKALVTQSANDAAVTIAENLAGTEENFARVMTAKARALGMTGTTFRNASGLPDPEQITTARDMAILAQHLIRDFPEYYSVFSAKSISSIAAAATAITITSCSAIGARTESRPAIRGRAATISAPPRAATTSISSPWSWAAGPVASATPSCAACSTRTSLRRWPARLRHRHWWPWKNRPPRRPRQSRLSSSPARHRVGSPHLPASPWLPPPRSLNGLPPERWQTSFLSTSRRPLRRPLLLLLQR